MPKHFFIVAGEPSGDAHAARLMRSLSILFPSCRFSGIGGRQMLSEGLHSFANLDDISVVGFWEVAKRYPMFRALLQQCSAAMGSNNPKDSIDAFIPVDYPGLNMRLAARARQLGVKVCWYIAPQLWAWGEHRAKELQKNTDIVLTVFPFEEDFFRRYAINAHFVGHPLCDVEMLWQDIVPPFLRIGALGEQEIALVPGSRRQEVQHHWRMMLEASSILHAQKPNTRFTLAAMPHLPTNLVEDCMEYATTKYPAVPLRVEPDVYALFRRASGGIVKAGTSTLEASLCGLPFVMMYRTSFVSYVMAKRAIQLSHIALPNILLTKEYNAPPIIRECIQDTANPEVLASELSRLLDDAEYVQTMTNGFRRLRSLLSNTNMETSITTVTDSTSLTNSVAMNAAQKIFSMLESVIE